MRVITERNSASIPFFGTHQYTIFPLIVYRMTDHVIMNQGKDGKDLLFNVMVNNDFQRANTWTNYVDRPTLHENKTIGRKILVSDIEADYF